MNLKKIGMISLVAVLAVSAAGCGNSTTSSSASSAASEAVPSESASESSSGTSSSSEFHDDTPITDEEDWKLEDCISVGDYHHLKLTKEVVEVTDEDAVSYAKSQEESEEVTDKNATVEDGDVVNIAYVGKKDGEAFDGGSSDSYDLEIGSNTFIDGFEEGIIGMKKGETKDLNLTFPENYGESSLAGQDVVFTVTVNKISRYPDPTEEAIESARTTLEENYDNSAESTLQANCWSAVLDLTEYKQLPKEYVDKGEETFEESVTQEAQSAGESLEDYVESVGLTQEQYEERKEQYGRSAAQNQLLLDYLVKQEGLSTEDEDYKTQLSELAKMYDMEEDAFVEQYGEETIEQYIQTSRVVNIIIGYADVTEKKVTSEEAAASAQQ